MSHYSINREYGITKYLAAAEERELIALGQAGDNDARNAVVMNILPIIVRDVGKAFLDRKRVPLDDIVNDAVARMIEKFNEFDLSRGLRFSTWAWWLIRDAVSRHRRRRKKDVLVFKAAVKRARGTYLQGAAVCHGSR